MKEQPEHPLAVKGARSEQRYLQPRHERFRPVPTSIAFCAISTGRKTSQMLTVANILYPVKKKYVRLVGPADDELNVTGIYTQPNRTTFFSAIPTATR